MRSRLGFLIVLLFLAGVMPGGCTRQSQQRGEQGDNGVEMTLSVNPEPPVVGQANLTITIQDSAGNPIQGAALDIKGDMSHAGMKPVLASTSDGDHGVYIVPFEWSMGGDWFVTVTATLPDGSMATQRFDLVVAGGMNMDAH